MSRLIRLANDAQDVLDSFRALDFLAPLLVRLYLAPVFWMAGTQKLLHMEDTIAWFGNPDWGLGLPLPTLMAWLAALTETVGAVLLLAGLAVRWVAVPLLVTMAVAALAVHWGNGWHAIAPSTDPEIGERLARARALLQEHGNYDWLTARGSFVILQNGIEFAVTYFILCLGLFFTGAGNYLSVDYWLARRWRGRQV